MKNFPAEITLFILTSISGKTRVFFVDTKKVEDIKQIFSIRDDEKIILAENEDSVNQLVDVMKNSADTGVFFITMEKL